MLQVQGGEPRCSPAKPWSENTGEPGRRSRWYVWGRASKRELLRQNDYKCLMSLLSLSSGHTRVGFSKMSIHGSFLVVMLSIFFPYISVIICLKYLGDPMLFYIFAYVCVCVCVCTFRCINPLSYNGLLWCLLSFFLKVYFVRYKNYHALFLSVFIPVKYLYLSPHFEPLCILKAEVSFL